MLHPGIMCVRVCFRRWLRRYSSTTTSPCVCISGCDYGDIQALQSHHVCVFQAVITEIFKHYNLTMCVYFRLWLRRYSSTTTSPCRCGWRNTRWTRTYCKSSTAGRFTVIHNFIDAFGHFVFGHPIVLTFKNSLSSHHYFMMNFLCQ